MSCDFCSAEATCEYEPNVWICNDVKCQKAAYRALMAEQQEDRERAHEQLDEDMGW